MNKKVILLNACLAVATVSMSQTAGGGISARMLQNIQDSQKCNIADKALFNAIASNSIDDLAKNHANQGDIDTYFQ